MGWLAALITPAIVKTIAGSLFDNAASIFQKYLTKSITREEAMAQLKAAITNAIAEIEQSHADALAKTFDSFMQAVSKSRFMQIIWGAVALSQLFIILWHQWGIPYLTMLCWKGTVSFGNATCEYPSSGDTAYWAYLLLAGCIGLGPVVLRAGPGAGNLVGKLKALIPAK